MRVIVLLLTRQNLEKPTRVKIMNTMTITIDLENNKVAFFKLKSLVSFNEFMDEIDGLVSVEDVIYAENRGKWTII